MQWSQHKFTYFWKQDEHSTNYKYKESLASTGLISMVPAVPCLTFKYGLQKS